MVVRALGPEEIDVFRSLRLAALATDPDAFSSSLEREREWSDEEWARRLAGFGERQGVVFVDAVDGEAVGMTGVGDQGGEAVVWGMWVAPAARRSGAGQRLLDAATGWATSIGARTLGLWVMRANVGAIALYTRAGFEPIVEGAPPAPPGCADERFMRRPLTP